MRLAISILTLLFMSPTPAPADALGDYIDVCSIGCDYGCRSAPTPPKDGTCEISCISYCMDTCYNRVFPGDNNQGH